MRKYSQCNQGLTGISLATNQKVGSSTLSGRTIPFNHLQFQPFGATYLSRHPGPLPESTYRESFRAAQKYLMYRTGDARQGSRHLLCSSLEELEH